MEKPDQCEAFILHDDKMRRAVTNLPADNVLLDMADLCKMFADFSRIKLLSLLRNGELCVCDLAKLMDINQSAISNHLRLLRGSKLVKYRKEGKCVYYSLADSHVETIIRQALEHVLEPEGSKQ